MNLVAVAMVRDEEDVLAPILNHLWLEGVDHWVIADNRSKDATTAILHAYRAAWPEKFTLIDDQEPGYYQREKMSKLAGIACDLGADWVLPFDADEVWYSLTPLTVKAALEQTPDDIGVLVAQGYDHIQIDYEPGSPFSDWRRDYMQRLPKVAFRATPDAMLHMGNHDVDHVPGRREWNVLGYRHFGYRSFEQMKRKVRQGKEAYDAAPDIHKTHGTHWRELGALGDRELRQEWEDLCGSSGLVHDPCPLRSSSPASTGAT